MNNDIPPLSEPPFKYYIKEDCDKAVQYLKDIGEWENVLKHKDIDITDAMAVTYIANCFFVVVGETLPRLAKDQK